MTPSPSDLGIRRATPEDVPVMVRLINEAFRVEAFMEGDRTDAARLHQLLADGWLLIAELAGAAGPVGCICLEVHGERGYFGMLSVDARRQGAGIGTALVRAAEEFFRARGFAEMEILVLSLRPELLPYYDKLGYRESHRAPFTPTRKVKDGFRCEGITLRKPL